MLIRIRFNENFPKGKKWIVIFHDGHEIQVDEFATQDCRVTSDTSEIENVDLKHYILIECDDLRLTMDKDNNLTANFE